MAQPGEHSPAWWQNTMLPRRVRLVEVQVIPGQERVILGEGVPDQPRPDFDYVRKFFFPEHDQNLQEARARMVRVSAALSTPHPGA